MRILTTRYSVGKSLQKNRFLTKRRAMRGWHKPTAESMGRVNVLNKHDGHNNSETYPQNRIHKSHSC